MMKIALLPALLISCCTYSQPKTAATKFAATITAAELKKKLTIIAGPAMEGRETATPGQKKAAAYIEDYYKKIGLLPGAGNGYQQVYEVLQDTLLSSALTVNNNVLAPTKDYVVSAASFGAGNWQVGNVIFASYGLGDSINNNFDGLNITNKWVMVIEGTPASMDDTPEAKTYPNKRQARLKAGEIKGKNIAGLLIITKDISKTKWSTEGEMYLKEKKAAVPVIYITTEIAASILAQPITNFTDLKTIVRGVYNTNLAFTEQATTQHLQSSNVIGILPGTDKKGEYVFVTGHYDHLGKKGDVIWYGADDDGSGTTSVLQMATAFAKAKAAGKGPRRSMVFMTVSGEEKGLWGSEYYTDHPVVPLDSTSVDLNIDMVGRIDPDYKGDSMNYVYTIGEDKLSSDLKRITDSVNNRFSHMELDRRYNDPKDPNRFYYRSDHYNFAKHGVPIIFYFNGVHADYHQPTDTVDKINFGLMAKRVKLVFYTAWDMANRENMLVRDIPLK